MKPLAVTILLIILPVSDSLAQTSATAFINVNVVPMDRERVLPQQSVVVKDGRIVAIGSARKIKIPKGAQRIDGTGKYLMPGLADMHAHFGRGEGVESYTLLLVANGVTTVRNMYGNPLVLSLRQQVNDGKLLGPQIFTTGPIIEGKGGIPGVTIVETPEQAEEAVTRDKRQGYDAIKVYNMLSAEAFDATVHAAHKLGLQVYAHVPLSVGLAGALAARLDSIEHLTGYMQALQNDNSPFKNTRPSRMNPQYIEHVDLGKIKALAEATRAAGVWNCPTLVIFQHQELTADAARQQLRRSEMKYMPPARLKSWEDEILSANSRLKAEDAPLYAKINAVRMKLVKALHDAGARLLLGTDFPPAFTVPGYSLHEELQNFVAAGLTPYQALRSGTNDAAEFLKKQDEFGTVAVGKRADLILLEANPLVDVRNAARRVGVMVHGRWLTEAELAKRLEKLASSYGKN